MKNEAFNRTELNQIQTVTFQFVWKITSGVDLIANCVIKRYFGYLIDYATQTASEWPGYTSSTKKKVLRTLETDKQLRLETVRIRTAKVRLSEQSSNEKQD